MPRTGVKGGVYLFHLPLPFFPPLSQIDRTHRRREIEAPPPPLRSSRSSVSPPPTRRLAAAASELEVRRPRPSLPRILPLPLTRWGSGRVHGARRRSGARRPSNANAARPRPRPLPPHAQPRYPAPAETSAGAADATPEPTRRATATRLPRRVAGRRVHVGEEERGESPLARAVQPVRPMATGILPRRASASCHRRLPRRASARIAHVVPCRSCALTFF